MTPSGIPVAESPVLPPAKKGIDPKDKTVKFYALGIILIVFSISMAIVGSTYIDNMSSMEKYDNLSMECGDAIGRCRIMAYDCSTRLRVNYTGYMMNESPMQTDYICDAFCNDKEFEQFDPLSEQEQREKNVKDIVEGIIQ